MSDLDATTLPNFMGRGSKALTALADAYGLKPRPKPKKKAAKRRKK
jgi:hypothetical protein